MPRVADVSTSFVEDYARLDPDEALNSFGIGASATELTDYSPAGAAARLELCQATLRQLEQASVEDEADRLGHLFMRTQLGGMIGRLAAGENERDLRIIGATPSTVRMVFDLAARSTESDWEALAARLEAVPAALAGYRQSLAKGLAESKPGSRRCSLAVAEQCETWGGAARDGGWFSTFASSYGEGALGRRLVTAASAADRAYAELGRWLRQSYAAKAADADGVGEERYRIACPASLGAVPDLAEAYAWGWEELGRLEAEKAAESARVVSGAGFEEVRQLLSNDRARGIEGAEAWRRWLQQVTDETMAWLDGNQFEIAEPLRRCDVLIPPKGSAAAPYYTPPSRDFSLPGRTWFPTVGREWFTTWDVVTTVYHETVPGHHLQVGWTRLVPLTAWHQLDFISAHGEGWALYAERLMDELGRFELPEQRLGFLCSQAFRAARVVVDIGLHTGATIPAGWPGAGERWSYDRAVDYIERASGEHRPFCESEVVRYLGWPSQAISYKLGERSWLAGREAARQASGPAFDLKDWHARALALGALGLNDLERELAALGRPGREG